MKNNRQIPLFWNEKENDGKIDIGNDLSLKFLNVAKTKLHYYRHNTLIKKVDLSDNPEKRLFVVEAAEQGAVKKRLADTIGISRQSVHNYLEIKENFGTEGLVHGYSIQKSRSRRRQRENHREKLRGGIKAAEVAKIRKKKREECRKKQLEFDFGFAGEGERLNPEETPFAEKHEWEETRYAGIFIYLIALISQCNWLKLVTGYFGASCKALLVFLVMMARNIRSVEQLKNVRSREAGVVAGIGRIGSRPIIWENFYLAAEKGVADALLFDYFRYQLRMGVVGCWLWFTDGHLLPYEFFCEEFEFSGKRYGVFEGEEAVSHVPENDNGPCHTFILRRIYIWNKKSGKRVSCLAWPGNICLLDTSQKPMDTEDCAKAILSRWGASENTFKHQGSRHPIRYHPGFKLVESENQIITNPEIKEKEGLIKKVKRALAGLYKKHSKMKVILNKDGKPRRRIAVGRIKEEISGKEAELNELMEEKKGLPDKIDVSLPEDYRSFKKIDNEGKNLFDFVLSSGWNARKQMVDWLRPMIDQENELADLFYAISDCHGWIRSTDHEVRVRLELLQQPKRRQAQEQLCRKLTGLGARTTNNKLLVIEVDESPFKKVSKKMG